MVTKETDLSKEQLITYIVKPYSRGKKFICNGSFVEPSRITTIRIIETEQPSSELLKKTKAEKGILKRIVSEETDIKLLEREGIDVTREVLFGEEQIQRKKAIIPLSKNIFLVHGRDHKSLKELKLMLEEFGLNPIVLHEKPGGSRTIVEKLEKYSDVGYAFIILTPDDVGMIQHEFEEHMNEIKHLLNCMKDYEARFFEGHVHFSKKVTEMLLQFPRRARQNVVLEFGYFIGLLGRDRVCCLYKGDVELPSDMRGIVYIPFKKSIDEKEVRNKIIKELKEAGYKIKV